MQRALTTYLLVIVVFVLGCAQPNSLSGPSSSPGHLAANSDLKVSNTDSDAVGSEDGIEEAGSEVNNGSSEKRDDADGNQGMLDSALELAEVSQEYWAAGDTDKALEALDQAYTLILQVEASADERLSQQKDDLRFMISKRVMEIYASRFRATNGNHNEIPLTLNQYVEREIKLFQTTERQFFLEAYQRSGKYRPPLTKAIQDAGLPEDLSWLPLIESGFKVRALSRARALGLWQFIPSTGYKFGLKRNAWVDERLDPEKATDAAIAYLKELHQIFGDWASVLAAYNCGEGRVLRVIRSQQINYLDNFWDLFERLPWETARYYPRFLATLHILKEPEKYGFKLETPDSPLPYEKIAMPKPVRLDALADRLGIADSVLLELNPELRQHATPVGGYLLRVPSGSAENVLASIDSLKEWTPPKRSYVYHRIRRGETLSTIAVRYRSSIRAIMEANNLSRSHFIRAGQRIKVPVKNGASDSV